MKILTLLLISFLCLSLTASEKPLVVVIPSYNNATRYERNLNSVFSQKYENFRVIYIDDASPDGTGNFVAEYVEKNQLHRRFTLIRNQNRQGTLANICQAVATCAPHEIIVDLDGDDFLAHDKVFARLNTVYSNPDIWVTYGSWMRYPENVPVVPQEISAELIEKNAFREIRGTGTTPLRTFYATLFQRINPQDFLYEGRFLQVTSDLAFMFPILEMAGHHIRFISDIDYVYDIDTSLNDHKLKREEQEKIDQFLRSKPKYLPLKSLYE